MSPPGQERLAVIGGSAAYDLLRDGSIAGRELGPIGTPYGPSAPLRELRLADDADPVLFLSRHGESGYWVTAPYVNYRSNVYGLRLLGVSHVIAWSGPGAIDETLEVGQYVVPDDLIDETRGRPSTFFENRGHGFIRQNPVFCPELRRLLVGAAEGQRRSVRDGGTYVCTQGPRLETPAEIRKYRLLGGHLVGMTLAPEVFLARELAMGYAAICYVTNYAEGVRARPYAVGGSFEGLATAEESRTVRAAVAALPELLRAVVRQADAGRFACTCHASMERFIRAGRVQEDWRTWVEP